MPSTHNLLNNKLKNSTDDNDDDATRKLELQKENKRKEEERKRAQLNAGFNKFASQNTAPQQETSPSFSWNIANNCVILKTDSPLDLDKIVKEYEKFVETTYKNHPHKEDFKAKKHCFNTLKDLQNSDFYKNLPEKLKNEFSAPGNPFPATYHVLTFDNLNDLLQFTKNIENKKLLPKGAAKALENQMANTQHRKNKPEQEMPQPETTTSPRSSMR